MAGAARMLKQAVPPSQGQALPAPGTAAAYSGSRRLAQRYEYSEQSTAGMVELHPKRLLSREEFKANLLAAPGVLQVFEFPKTFVATRGSGWPLGVSGSLGGLPWEVILGSPRLSWSRLGPSWTLQRLANPPVQVQGRR